MNLEDRLDALGAEFDALGTRLADPDLLADPRRYAVESRRYRELEAIVAVHGRLRAREDDLVVARELFAGSEGAERELARSEVLAAEAEVDALGEELRVLLLPRDPNDDKNVIMEIRGAEGGEEANLFARDLFEMYRGYAARQGWRFEVLSSSPSDLGGFNEVTFRVEGDHPWTRLRGEAGPHRVQRVPVTESQGRIHTSSATVTVLPEADEVDVEIDPADLQIDVYRSSGAGGQHVNTTDSAVRITHMPSGIVVSCQVERSQIQNRERAMQMLRAKLADRARQERDEELNRLAGEKKKVEWGSQIRSYVLQPYQMVKDERTGHQTSNVEAVLDGDVQDFIDAYLQWQRAESVTSA